METDKELGKKVVDIISKNLTESVKVSLDVNNPLTLKLRDDLFIEEAPDLYSFVKDMEAEFNIVFAEREVDRWVVVADVINSLKAKELVFV